MIFFSPAKINIGLQILRKRDDGFHDISTFMLPVPFYDIIEIMPKKSGDEKFSLFSTGIPIPGKAEDNLCYKAWDKFALYSKTPGIKVHIHKQIPLGAGLGGGSSNASTVIKGLNTLTNNVLQDEDLIKIALEVGSDCPFFIKSQPAIARGKGEILSRMNLHLKGYYLQLLNPGIMIDTRWAYGQVMPDETRSSLEALLREPVTEWKDHIKNDFEPIVMKKYPIIDQIKQDMYSSGAIYASMTGSGSSVFGIFYRKPKISPETEKYLLWEGTI